MQDDNLLDVLFRIKDNIVALDNNFIITYVNQAFADTVGLKVSEMCGKNIWIILHQAVGTTIYEKVNEAVLKKEVKHFEWMGVYSKSFLETTIFPSDNGATIISRDITERKKAEAKLIKSQSLLAQTQHVAGIGSWEWDIETQRVIFSDELYHIYGIEKATFNLTVESFLGIIHPLDREIVTKAINDTMSERKTVDFEYRVLSPNGEKLVHAKSMIASYNNKGYPIEIKGIVQDITQARQLQNKLETYSKHLEELVKQKTEQLRLNERLAAIGETAGMVGHDLRNPLQTITNELFLAQDELRSLPEGASKDALKEIIDSINEQIKYMDKIVSDLQTFIKPIKPDKRIIKINPFIDALLAQTNIPKNIQIKLQIEKDSVEADAELLKRVLNNLIINAIQAMPEGGKLAIKTQTTNQGQIQITVEDTGTGIPEKVKPKIFTPLFTTKPKGQGFGLAVCKRVIEAQDGTISFESQEGKGTKFTVSLPCLT